MYLDEFLKKYPGLARSHIGGGRLTTCTHALQFVELMETLKCPAPGVTPSLLLRILTRGEVLEYPEESAVGLGVARHYRIVVAAVSQEVVPELGLFTETFPARWDGKTVVWKAQHELIYGRAQQLSIPVSRANQGWPE